MPYINKDLRSDIDESIDDLINIIHFLKNDKLEGIANYIVSRIITGILKPDKGWNYGALNKAIGVLECSKLELYRRLAAPYEDKCIDRNGDLEEYKIDPPEEVIPDFDARR